MPPADNPVLYHSRQLLYRALTSALRGDPQSEQVMGRLEEFIRELVRDELHEGLQAGLRDRFRKEE